MGFGNWNKSLEVALELYAKMLPLLGVIAIRITLVRSPRYVRYTDASWEWEETDDDVSGTQLAASPHPWKNSDCSVQSLSDIEQCFGCER